VSLKEIPLAEKLVLSVAEVSSLTGVCRSNIYLAVSGGKLRAIKRGRSTLIRPDDLKSWIDSLPSFTPSTIPVNERTRKRRAAA
jgi:excisionase family DNA binding protein